MDSSSPHTLTWYRAPFGSPGGYLAPIPKFPRPNFVRDIFCFKYRLVGCPEHRSGMPCSSTTVIAHLEPPSLRKRSKTGKKGLFGPQNTLLVLYVIELYSIVLHGTAYYYTGLYSLYSAPANYRVVHLVIFTCVTLTVPSISLQC